MAKLYPKVLIAALLWIPLFSACSTDQTITIENAWTRPALSGDNGAVYFEIDNPGPTEEAILGASSEVAASVEIHESAQDSAGTMSMHPRHQVPVPAGEQVVFEPGGLHVMLKSLNRDLKLGDSFSLTLTFEESGDKTVSVEVKQP